MSDPLITDSDHGRPTEDESVSRLSLVDNTAVPTVDGVVEVSFEQAVIGRLDHIIMLLNDARNGVGATYSGVAQILNLLAGVQQVAAMMPGKIGKAVREMASNPPNGVGQ